MAAFTLVCATASTASALPAHFWGLAWGGGYEGEPAEMDSIQRSGAKVLRYHLNGCEIALRHTSHPGEEWKPYEEVFRLAWERGISILPYLHGNPNCVKGVDVHQFPTEAEWKPAGNPWETFVYEAVQRFGYSGSFWVGKAAPKPVSAWEIWNEPNQALNNPGGAGVYPNAFGKFLVRTSQAIHAAEVGGDPAILVGGLVTSQNTTGSMSVKSFVEGMHTVTDIGAHYDQLGLHPYAFKANNGQAPTTPEQVTQVKDKVKANIEEARKVLLTVGANSKKIWITELGWPIVGDAAHPGVSAAIQAQLLTSTFSMIAAAATELGVDHLSYYNDRDNGVNEWAYFCGLRELSGNYRPAWVAYQGQTGAAPWPPPTVQTNPAIGIKEKEANLSAWINPNARSTSYRFEYGTSTSYGNSIPVPDGNAGSGSSAVWMSAVTPGLQPSTEYHYRAVSGNAAGVTYGADREFETPRAAVPAPSPSATKGWDGVIWRGTDGNIYETHADSGNWESYALTWSKKGIPSGVTPVGNPVPSPTPAGGWDGVIWHGSDGNIYETHADSGNWESYALTWSKQGIPSGVTPIGDPVPSPTPAGGWDGVIWHGSDGNIYETHADSGNWESYALTWSKKGIPSGVTPVGNPVPSPTPAGGWDGVIWRGSDGNIYETHADSGNWESYALTWSKQGIPPGVKAVSDPVPSPTPAGGWDGVMWRASDGNVYETHADSGNWESYSPTFSKKGIPAGVTVVGNPVPSPSATKGWDGVIWRGSDGNVYESKAPGGVWQAYSPTWSKQGIPSPTTIVGDPVPSPTTSGGWDGILWRGSDGNVYETHAPGGVWQSYSPTWSKKGVPAGVSMAANVGP